MLSYGLHRLLVILRLVKECILRLRLVTVEWLLWSLTRIVRLWLSLRHRLPLLTL